MDNRQPIRDIQFYCKFSNAPWYHVFRNIDSQELLSITMVFSVIFITFSRMFHISSLLFVLFGKCLLLCMRNRALINQRPAATMLTVYASTE